MMDVAPHRQRHEALPNSRSPFGRALSICIISDDLLPGATGVGIHTQCIAKELARRGHHICAITTRRKDQPSFEVWEGVNIYRVFSLKMFGYYQALAKRKQIERVLRDNAVNIVHYHYLGLLFMKAYGVASRLPGIKHIYTYHIPIEMMSGPWLLRPLRGIIFNSHARYCNRFDRILAPTDRLVKQIEEMGIRTDICTLSNPVMLEAAGATDPVKSTDQFVVLYVGRLSPEKNLPYLLRAFQALAQRTNRCRLWIAGTGVIERTLVKLSRELDIASKVRFLGQVDHADLPQYYAGCDVFVLPSLLETQGLAVMEAMRCAKPVIVTDRIVSARELVDDGGNGYIVDPDSVADLTEKLWRLSGDPGLCSAMGRASRQRSECYNPDRIVTELEGHYKDLVRRT